MAFSLHDGKVKKAEELTDIQKREALSEVPSVLGYLSYVLCFQTILTGPLCFYADYRDYIDGTNLPTSEKDRKVGRIITVT
jgi:lysophospholipid acyltransferase 1/2